VQLQKTVLSAKGYEVAVARNGLEALQKVELDPPDLILLDIMMPTMDGFEVCKRLKNNEGTRFIPIIIVTALDEVEDKIKGIEAGADDFIIKPFNKHELLARVKSLLRIKHLHDQLEDKVRELEEAQKRLRELAITDGLTDLHNYRFFKEQLTHEIDRAKRHDLHFSIIMLDIDHFKQYNDTHGHLAGDAVLKNMAKLLRQNVRKIDIAARYGGEEFALVLIETNKTAARFVAQKLKKLVAEYPFSFRESQPNGKLTISMGVSTYPDDGTSYQKLVDIADKRLYQAKSLGRNKVVLN
jgi:diguanylate cyclase (GGDEF)-like protein